jgi:hypothetical protein
MMENKLTVNKMVKEVDNFINELGFVGEYLEVKTNQDKVLFYYNYIDKNNLFKGILEFPSHYYIRLANLLCNTTERMKEFQEKIYDADGNFAEQFRKYRRYLLDSRGKDVESLYEVLKIVIDNRCWSNLHSVLMELFLEPFDEWICDRIVDMIHNGLNASDIYNWYKSGKNIKAIITFK